MGGGALYVAPSLVFCPFLKISPGNLKIFDLAKVFVADAHMKKISKQLDLDQSTLEYWSENRPKARGLMHIVYSILCKKKPVG